MFCFRVARAGFSFSRAAVAALAAGTAGTAFLSRDVWAALAACKKEEGPREHLTNLVLAVNPLRLNVITFGQM